MRYPTFLKDGGTIGCIAPSFGCNIEPYHSAFDNALRTWKALGYQIKLGPNCYEGSGIGISNTPEKCAAEVNDFFADPDCDVILSCGGGELMCEIVSQIDFQALASKEPRWFMGFSDNTNLTFLLPTLCDTAAIYGPCAPAFGMRTWHPAIEDAWRLLQGKRLTLSGYGKWEKDSLKDEEHPLEPYHVTEPTNLVIGLKERLYFGEDALSLPALSLQGRLIGGCLDCLDTLVGTRFDQVEAFQEKYKQDGLLWFLEACDLNPMGIRRAIWQLEEAGWFRYTKGFLIGRPLCFGEELMGLDHYHAFWDLLKEYEVPVILDADLGHLPPSIPLITGANAELTIQQNTMNLHFILS